MFTNEKEPQIEKIKIDSFEKLTNFYNELVAVKKSGEKNPENYEKFYSQKEQILAFLSEQKPENITKSPIEQDHAINALGILSLIAQEKKEDEAIAKIKRTSNELLEIESQTVNFSNIKNFVKNVKKELEDPESDKEFVFVVGHKNPDADASISALAEAYRKSLLEKDENTIYVPLIQSNRIPDEVIHLIGEDMANNLLKTNDDAYKKHQKNSSLVLVDENEIPQIDDKNMNVLAVVDHHKESKSLEEYKKEIPITREMSGSTITLIIQKYAGMGIKLDEKTAKMLLGGALLDSEKRTDKKTSSKDVLAMDNVQKISEADEDKLYSEAMSAMLSTDDANLLFERDKKPFKIDEQTFGFAVSKVKNMFSADGKILKKELLNDLQEKTKENKENFTLTKIVDYLGDNETVNREKIYLSFDENFNIPKDKVFETIVEVIKTELKNVEISINKEENSIEFWGVGKQLSRKKIAPPLMELEV